MNDPGSRVICVLGMHRSGTSMAASLTESLGVYLGSVDDLFDPLPDEPRSHWELRALRDLNDTLLARHGGGWDDPPVFPPGWEHASALDDLAAAGAALLAARFSRHPAWGWKDPRTCLTLPFWRRLRPDAHYVICLRHPLEVAQSLGARDGFSLAHGLRLWLAYTAAAVVHTAGQPRLFLFYDDVLQRPAAAVAALGAFVGATPAASRAALDRVAPDRRHHRCTDAKPAGARGGQAALALYGRLRQVAPESGTLDAASDEAMTAASADVWRAQAAAAGRERRALLPSARRALASSLVRVRRLAGRRSLRPVYAISQPSSWTIASSTLEVYARLIYLAG